VGGLKQKLNPYLKTMIGLCCFYERAMEDGLLELRIKNEE
jgi:hypothetical protein